MIIDEIKRIPIADIATRLGIKPDRHGMVLCFNGHDTKASCKLYPHTNSFFCFGCGIGGSSIDLVKEKLKIPTREAIKVIKQQYNLDPKQKTTTPARPAKSLHRGNDKVYKAIEQSSKKDGREFSYIYQDLLDMLDPEGAAIYLEGRGIRRNIIERAGIKSIPKAMNAIKKALNDKYGMERLQDAGIVAMGSTGRPYFVFIHHRIIIPYHDTEGNIINLQGRDIDGGSGAKYRFLSEIAVPMYTQQKLKDLAPGATIYLCEGAIDVLSAFNSVLTLPSGSPALIISSPSILIFLLHTGLSLPVTKTPRAGPFISG